MDSFSKIQNIRTFVTLIEMFLFFLTLLSCPFVAESAATCFEDGKCSCNMTNGNIVSGSINDDNIDERLVALAGALGALSSSLAITVVALLSTKNWVSVPKVAAAGPSTDSQDRFRPPSTTPSSTDSWASSRRSKKNLLESRPWLDSPGSSARGHVTNIYRHSRVWPGASNESTF